MTTRSTIVREPMANKFSPESFFPLLKRERATRRTYITRDAVRQGMLKYIEVFYNPNRRHTKNDIWSPIYYEIKQQKLNDAGV